MKATALNDDDKKALNAWFDVLSSADQAAFLSNKCGGASQMAKAARTELTDLWSSTSSVVNKFMKASSAKQKGVLFLKTTRGTEEQCKQAITAEAKRVELQTARKVLHTERTRVEREQIRASGGTVPMRASNKKRQKALETHIADNGNAFNFGLNKDKRQKLLDHIDGGGAVKDYKPNVDARKPARREKSRLLVEKNQLAAAHETSRRNFQHSIHKYGELC